jgi:hypothetical protein
MYWPICPGKLLVNAENIFEKKRKIDMHFWVGNNKRTGKRH